MTTYTVTRNELTVALRRLGDRANVYGANSLAGIIENMVGVNQPITLDFKADGSVQTSWATYVAGHESEVALARAINEVLAMRSGGTTVPEPGGSIIPSVSSIPRAALWIGGGVLAAGAAGLLLWHFSKGRKR